MPPPNGFDDHPVSDSGTILIPQNGRTRVGAAVFI